VSRCAAARAALLVGVFALLAGSPTGHRGDARYTLLLTESLLHERSFDLARWFAPDAEPSQLRRDGDLPYQVHRVGAAVYHYFPPGSALLSTPMVAVLNIFGISALDDAGRLDKRGARRLHRVIAALLVTLFGALVYAQARLLLTETWSVGLALAAVFSTQGWSVASRALYSHTWQIALVAAALLLVLRHARGRGALHPAWLATLLSWAYFTRPTAALSVAAVGLYLLLRARRALPAYVATGLAWLGLFCLYSQVLYADWLPPYFLASRLGNPRFGEALLGNLVSPARGVFVFLPQLLFVAWLCLRYRARLPDPMLVALAGGFLVCHWLVVSSFGHWWGGHGFGPRFMTDALPWLALLALQGLRAWRDAAAQRPPAAVRRTRLEAAVGACLLGVALLIHGGGALSRCGHRWNVEPASVDERPERIWDWSDSQALAPWRCSRR
jgi:hypothetical protein